MVLNPLKFINKELWGPSKQGIAIIKSRKDKSTKKGFSGLFSKNMTNGRNATNFEVACATDLGNMLPEGE